MLALIFKEIRRPAATPNSQASRLDELLAQAEAEPNAFGGNDASRWGDHRMAITGGAPKEQRKGVDCAVEVRVEGAGALGYLD